MADDTVGDGDVRPSHGVIYLDNQASTRPDPRVVEAMAPWLDVAANPHATEHATGRAAAAAVEQARERVANLLRCEPAEITFTSGATEASNIVLRGLLHSDDRLIISAIEHPSVAAAAQALMPHGVDVTTEGGEADGLMDLEALEEALGGGASLVSVRSEEHTSELQSLMRISYAVFC